MSLEFWTLLSIIIWSLSGIYAYLMAMYWQSEKDRSDTFKEPMYATYVYRGALMAFIGGPIVLAVVIVKMHKENVIQKRRH